MLMLFQPAGSSFVIGGKVQKFRARAVLSKNPNHSCLWGFGHLKPQSRIDAETAVQHDQHNAAAAKIALVQCKVGWEWMVPDIAAWRLADQTP